MGETAAAMTTNGPHSNLAHRRAPRPIGHPLLGAFPLAVMTLATFFVVFTILMARLQSGMDPALTAMARPVRHVLVKRIYERVIVVHLPSQARQPAASSSQQMSAEGGAFSSGVPVTRTS
jgi:hypothetical protein